MGQSQPNDEHADGEKEQPPGSGRSLSWTGALILLALVVAALIIASRFLDTATTDPVQFVTGNLLNALIFLAILGQVYIYTKQRDIMERQWNVMEGQFEIVKQQQRTIDYQFITSGVQAEAMLNQWGIMREQTTTFEDQLAAMRGQLQAMNGQAALIARQLDALIASERAYVAIDEFGLRNLEIGQAPIAKVILVNGGRTPAWQLNVQAAFNVGEHPGEFSWDEDFERPGGTFFLAAGQTIPIELPVTLNLFAEIFSLLEAGKISLFLAGEIRYLDWMGSLHIQEFGAAYDFSARDFTQRYNRHRTEQNAN
jgi:hypothetical protein